MGFETRWDSERRCGRDGGRFGGEPSLAEMLADPVVQAVMTVDHVTAGDIERLMWETRERREDCWS
jgi:hypothetical protein